MIFSADLDGTLIFSKRWLDPGQLVVPVEYRHGEPFGFMKPGAKQCLCELMQKTIFVVNTLRGEEQARRVEFVQNGGCRYLCTQNGLYLYKNGQRDMQWSKVVERAVDGLSLPLCAALDLVLKHLPGIACLSKQYEYMGVFFVDGGSFEEDAYQSLRQELARQGWELFRQRRKLYVSPLSIHKGTVLQWICRKEQQQAVGFGDSYFDRFMLEACTDRYSLAQSELAQIWPDPSVIFSSRPTLDGTEESLNRIRDKIQEMKEC